MRAVVLLAGGVGVGVAGLSLAWSLVLIVVLLAASAFFSGSEIAVVSASRARLEHLSNEGRRDARSALRLLENTPRTVASILVGTNLSNIGAASLSTALAVRYSPEYGPEIATLVLTPVVLFAAEILPKAFFRSRPTRLLRACAGSLHLFARLFAPLMVITTGATRAMLFVFPIREEGKRPVFRRKDLENLFMFGAVRDESPIRRKAKDGGVALRMAGKALDLREKRVTKAMAPLRSDLTCPESATVGEAKERFRAAGSGHLALLDEAGQVTGFIAAKGLLGEPDDRPLRELAHPAHLLDEKDTLDEVMQSFRSHQQGIGLVRDRSGRTLGVVTAEDVFEEVVGELTRLAGAGRATGEATT